MRLGKCKFASQLSSDLCDQHHSPVGNEKLSCLFRGFLRLIVMCRVREVVVAILLQAIVQLA